MNRYPREPGGKSSAGLGTTRVISAGRLHRRDDEAVPTEQQQGARWRLARQLARGGPAAHGGCTDAAVRLSHLLKVRAPWNAPRGAFTVEPAPLNHVPHCCTKSHRLLWQ